MCFSLQESVESLQGQVSMLDVNMLDHTEARIQNLIQKMDQVKEKSAAGEAKDGDKDTKVRPNLHCRKNPRLLAKG